MTTSTSRLAAVIDTGVYGAGLVGRSDGLAARYAPHLLGRILVLSFQTVAELRYGALHAGWGDRRRAALEERLAQARVVPSDDSLATTYAELRQACVRAGHALGAKAHTGDAWIAATAVRHGLPLVSDDTGFVGCPGLNLVREAE